MAVVSTVMVFPQTFFDAIATSLLAATNGSATVAAQLAELDAAISTRARPSDVQTTVTASPGVVVGP